MKKSLQSTGIPAPSYDQAGEWFVRHREAELDEAERQAFDAWLRASPQNVQAYLEVSSTWEDVTGLDTAWNPGENTNVIPIVQTSPRAAQTRREGVGRARKIWVIAASILVTVVAVGIWMYGQRPTLYTTAIGEQRSVTLPDGSTLILNARSRMRLQFDAHERRIELLEGQGLFNVVHESGRPFVVSSGATRVQAVGTQFDVYRRDSGITVTVVEGRVAVVELATHDVQTQPVLLNAGQQLIVATNKPAQPPVTRSVQVTQADIEAATAWTERRLVFQSAPLSEVVEQFNRYSVRPLTVADPALEGYRVSGVFSSMDPDPLLRFLRLQKGIAVTESSHDIRIVQK